MYKRQKPYQSYTRKSAVKLIIVMNVPPPNPSSIPTEMNPMKQINPPTSSEIPVVVVTSDAKMSKVPDASNNGLNDPEIVIKSLQINEKRPPVIKITITHTTSKTGKAMTLSIVF